MEFIIVDVYDECINFSNDDFESKFTHQFGKVYTAERFDPSKEYELGTVILQNKGDGMTIKVNSNNNIHFIEVFLLYGELDAKSQEDLILSIKKWLDTNFDDFEEEDKIRLECDENYEDGFFIKVEGVEKSDFLVPLIDSLESEGIRAKVVNHKKVQNEWGAGSYFEQILLFITSSISSGIAWDLIKGRLNILMDQFRELDKSKQIQGFDIQKIITKVAENVGENSFNLQLIDMEVAEELYVITLKTRYQEIKVKCNNEYHIKSCNIKELTKTRI